MRQSDFVGELVIYMMNYSSLGQPIKDSHTRHTLWISGQSFAHNLQSLKANRITAVCSVGSDPFTFPETIKHLYIDIEDIADQTISIHFSQAYQFLDSNLEQGNVLVHCMAGVSRSATIAINYLVKKHGWTVEQSLSKIRESRPIVMPNYGFYRQLKEAEQGIRVSRPRL